MLAICWQEEDRGNINTTPKRIARCAHQKGTEGQKEGKIERPRKKYLPPTVQVPHTRLRVPGREANFPTGQRSEHKGWGEGNLLWEDNFLEVSRSNCGGDGRILKERFDAGLRESATGFARANQALPAIQ